MNSGENRHVGLLIEQDHPLAELTTMRVQASARFYTAVSSADQLGEAIAFARDRGLPHYIIGGGSNLLFAEDYPGLIIRLALRGIRLEEEDDESVRVRVAAGENWHGFVSHCLAQGWYGLENLALIPGSVGAAPVQNIGAYGVEVERFLESVQVFDTHTGKVSSMRHEDCRFAYRDSIFKHEEGQGKIILWVCFRLSRQGRPALGYASLDSYLAERGLLERAAAEPEVVYEAVCAIRRSRLPDPAVLANSGSFFKNPVVDRTFGTALQQRYPDMPLFPTGDSASFKIPAAWLIEQAGWKGKRHGDAGVYDRQALVLVNHGEATGQQMLALAQEIMADLRQRFGVMLEPEVRILPPGKQSLEQA